MKLVKFIYNPNSGDGGLTQHLDSIISIYQRKGYCIVPFRLTFDCEDEEIIEGIDDSYDHILIAGGDGTINHIVNILKNNDIDVPIAVLPTGTANDFATMLGMSTNIATACRSLVSGEVRCVDIARANDKYFVNVFSCGLFTEISQKTPTLLKNTFGKLAYYFSSLQELPNFKRLHITIHSEGREVFSGSSLVFFVFNGKTAGNLRLAYLSDVQDGLLDVLIIKDDNIVENIRTVAHFLRHDTNQYPKGVMHFKSNDIVIKSLHDETTDIDGQPGPSFPIIITCESGGLRILCPKVGVRKRRR